MIRFYIDSGCGIIEFDDRRKNVNLLSLRNIARLKKILSSIARPTVRVHALFFTSAKKGIFIAGADIKELFALRRTREALLFLKEGQGLCNSIEAMPIPTCAIVSGACLGGGLELALSCNAIFCVAGRNIKIGFPEKRLGIKPGFGGVRRLREKIGHSAADRLIESGRILTAEEALEEGIVDRIIRPEEEKRYDKLTRKVPIQRPVRLSVEDKESRERKEVAALLLKAPAKNAFSAFMSIDSYRKRLRKRTGIMRETGIRHCAIVGSGKMGSDIAYLINSNTDITVDVSDLKKEALLRSERYIARLLKDAVSRGILTAGEMEKKKKNIFFKRRLDLRKYDMLIECIDEDIRKKGALFSSIERGLKDDCIVGTNTSCLPVRVLSESFKRPGRFLGIHFFNPAFKMKLVEVVLTHRTDKKTALKAERFLLDCKRVPLRVKDSPGFLVNRILLPYLNEALLMLQEGYPRDAIDAAAMSFGMPLGPLQLIENIGTTVTCDAIEVLADSLGASRLRPAPLLRSLRAKKRIPDLKKTPRLPVEGILKRLLRPMKKEARLCIKEKIVSSRELMDIGLFLGTGFPFTKRLWKG